MLHVVLTYGVLPVAWTDLTQTSSPNNYKVAMSGQQVVPPMLAN
jgi:hypothetical protein